MSRSLWFIIFVDLYLNILIYSLDTFRLKHRNIYKRPPIFHLINFDIIINDLQINVIIKLIQKRDNSRLVL